VRNVFGAFQSILTPKIVFLNIDRGFDFIYVQKASCSPNILISPHDETPIPNFHRSTDLGCHHNLHPRHTVVHQGSRPLLVSEAVWYTSLVALHIVGHLGNLGLGLRCHLNLHLSGVSCRPSKGQPADIPGLRRLKYADRCHLWLYLGFHRRHNVYLANADYSPPEARRNQENRSWLDIFLGYFVSFVQPNDNFDEKSNDACSRGIVASVASLYFKWQAHFGTGNYGDGTLFTVPIMCL
jgi:hypothetical protein